MSTSPAPRAPLDLRLKWLVLLLVVGGAFYLLAPVLMPFAVAAMFAYLASPLATRLERYMGRGVAVSLIFVAATLLLVLALLLLVPLIERQIGRFLAQLPTWLDWFQDRLRPWLEARFGVSAEALDARKLVAMLQEHWRQAGGFAMATLAGVSKSGMAVVGWMLNIVLIPVVGFYLLRDWNLLLERIHALVPRHVEPVVVRLAGEADSVLGAFVRGQASVMLALGTFYGTALWLVGIGVGPIIGMIAGLISFVPYLGAIVGIGMGLVAALVQYQDWTHVGLVAGVFVVGQLLEGYVLTPRLVGDRIGLHPVAVIFAVLAGGQLFGFLGVLLALPAAAVVMVLLRYAWEEYRASELYGAPAVASAASPPAPVEVEASGAGPAAPAVAVEKPDLEEPAAGPAP